MFGKLDANTFLQECITTGIATVSAKELRNLLQEKRKLERENKQLRNKIEVLQLRNSSLENELTEERCNRLEVVGIDIRV